MLNDIDVALRIDLVHALKQNSVRVISLGVK